MKTIMLYIICYMTVTYSHTYIEQNTSIKIYAQTNSIQKKITDLKLVLERDPNDVNTLLTLSRLLLKSKRYTEALSYLQQLNKIPTMSKANRSKGLYYLAFTHRKLKNYPSAVDSYRAMIKVTGENVEANDAYFGLAKTYELMGDTVAAVEAFETFIQREKRPSEKRFVKVARASIKRLQKKVANIDQKNEDEVVILDDDEEDSQPTSGTPSSNSSAKTQSNQTSTQNKANRSKSSKKSTTAQKQGIQKTVGTDTKKGLSRPTSKHSTLSKGKQALSLDQADQAFVKGDYQIAQAAYLRLLDQLKKQKASIIEVQQLYYQSAVSAFLGQDYQVALALCEDALLLGEHPMLEGLATLSYSFQKQKPQVWPDIKLALQEARFTHALDLISNMKKQPLTNKQTALLHRAQGKAYMGLHRFQNAYQSFKKASTQFSHILLDLELAQSAEASHNYKAAQGHYRSIMRKLETESLLEGSKIFTLAKMSLDRLRKGK